MARKTRKKVAKTETVFNPDEPAVLPYSQAWLFRIWVGLIMIIIGYVQLFVLSFTGGILLVVEEVPAIVTGLLLTGGVLIFMIINVWGTLLYTTKDLLNPHPETDKYGFILRVILFASIGLQLISSGFELAPFLQDAELLLEEETAASVLSQTIDIIVSIIGLVSIFFFARYIAGIMSVIKQPRFGKSLITASNVFLGTYMIVVITMMIALAVQLSMGTTAAVSGIIGCVGLVMAIAALAYLIYIIIAWFKILGAWKRYDKDTHALDRKHRKRAAAIKEIEAQAEANPDLVGDTEAAETPIDLEGEE